MIDEERAKAAIRAAYQVAMPSALPEFDYSSKLTFDWGWSKAALIAIRMYSGWKSTEQIEASGREAERQYQQQIKAHAASVAAQYPAQKSSGKISAAERSANTRRLMEQLRASLKLEE